MVCRYHGIGVGIMVYVLASWYRCCYHGIGVGIVV